MIFLQSPTVEYRTMLSFYMFAAIFIAASSMCRRGFLYVWLMPIILSIAVSYQYGVATKNQRDYGDNIMNLIQYDLLNHHIDHWPTYVLGGLMRAPHAERISDSQVFINHIVHPAGGLQVY